MSIPPLHRQIAQSIYDDIVQRQLAAHTRIPSEVALARQYGVSHGTIAKALEDLVHARILYRQRPRGTFVAEYSGAHSFAPASSPTSPKPSAPPAQISTEANPEETQPQIPAPAKPALIGIVLPVLHSAFMGRLLNSVEVLTRAAGHGLIFAQAESDISLERYQVEQFLKQGVAGIIIFAGEHKVTEQDGQLVSGAEEQPRLEYLRLLQQRAIPFVLLDRYVPEIDCSYVISDDYAAGYAATQHLITLGHRRIGFATAPYYLTSSYYRYLGYTHCLQDYRLPVDESLVLRSIQYLHITEGSLYPHSFQENQYSRHDRAEITAYLQRSDAPDAVVAMNDLIAFHILQATEALGIAIPEQLALVCCGETNIGAFVSVPFTSILQPVEEIGRQSASLLLDMIASRTETNHRVILPVSLIVRQSSGAPANDVPQFIAANHQE